MDALEIKFEQAVRHSIERCKDHGYNPTYFIRMVDQYGVLESTHRLLQSIQPQEGLFILWEKKLPHLSIEALVLDPRFKPLFSPEELDRARQRLEDLGYSVAD